MPDVDELRDEAMSLLRELVRMEANYAGYALFLYRDADDKMNDLGRQFITAQANYTNALRDWEAEKC